MSHSFVGVAQLDRAFGYGPKGRGFESSNPRTKGVLMVQNSFFRLWKFLLPAECISTLQVFLFLKHRMFLI